MGKTRVLQALVLAGALLVPASPAFAAEPKPNFVFILTDDMGWTDLGCFGSDLYQTPNIDRLATQGVRFTNA
ncbi:MAG: sulfatase-like hydrolase/transferase, partial [Planctomycetota bacterium]|nr:sulfatase-like hydrolase/transferase [Planctomycetota bacterium]